MVLLFCYLCIDRSLTPHAHTLSLHDALPILNASRIGRVPPTRTSSKVCTTGTRPLAAVGGAAASSCRVRAVSSLVACSIDRKSTRLNSSHLVISYAVFCLKKKIDLCDILHV